MIALKEISKKECEDKLARNPESFVFSRLADCYRKRGDIQRAIEVCTQGLASHPDSITGRVILGRCYLEQEKYKEAAGDFIKVVEYDRRNQVALKMLADVYAHQGMTEKAGDIYSFLLTVDPENQSIANLAANFTGSGTTNIYRILGLSEPTVSASQEPGGSGGAEGDDIFVAPAPVAAPSADPFRDTAAQAFAQTIQMDPEELRREASEQPFNPFAEPEGPGAGAEELAPQTAQQDGVEEVVADIYQGEGSAVTGDDISARMSMMFKEEGALPEAAREPAEQPMRIENEMVSEAAPISIESQADKAEEPSESMPANLSGSDISSRIDQLFGEAGSEGAQAPPQLPQPDYTEMFDGSPPVENENTPLQESILATEEVHAELAKLEEEGGERNDVSGEDIVSRMSEIFEETGGRAVVVESSEETLSPERADELVTGLGEIPDDAEIAEQISLSDTIEQLSRQGAVSGEDIAQRLETIFEEEQAASPLASLSPVEENTAPPDAGADMPPIADSIVLENALTGQEEPLEAAEATVVQIDENDALLPIMEQAPASAPAGEIVDLEPTTADVNSSPEDSSQRSFNETVDEAEPEEIAPEMSGDDIRSRLDEIFPESLISEETLTMVDEIPEGDKEDEKPNEGFYTMSGDDAVSKPSDETLLKQLDEPPIEPVEEGNDAQAAQLGPDRFGPGLTVPAPFADDIAPEVYSLSPETPDVDRLNAIPDHVLTPTLADIYFQQGQPHLAVQIYSRLLEKEPDNEKLAKRLEQIKSMIGDNLPQAPAPPRLEESAEVESNTRERKSPSVRTERKKPVVIPKPLAGVRIKKRKK
jgi:tetratricopeptide (TPR) repeat protein